MQLGLPFTRPAPRTPPKDQEAASDVTGTVESYTVSEFRRTELPPSTVRPVPSPSPLSPDAWPAGPAPSREAIEFVRHPRARRYVIRVRGDGTVRVTIPRGGSKREAQDFARRQQRWIEQERERVAEDATRSLETTPPEVVRELRARAARELPRRILELAVEHDLHVSRISVRNQRWRWGSCSRSGHICLNWRLVRMPPDIRDYVMIHELMHLRRMDHSPTFWKLVAAACPEYQTAREWLRAAPRN